MWPYLALGGDGDEAGKHKQAVLGTEEDLWPPSFCKIGGGLRAPKGFRHVGATPAPTTPLLKIPVFPREALPGRPERGASPGLLEGEKLPPKREHGSSASLPGCFAESREHVELILPGAGRQITSREAAPLCHCCHLPAPCPGRCQRQLLLPGGAGFAG